MTLFKPKLYKTLALGLLLAAGQAVGGQVAQPAGDSEADKVLVHMHSAYVVQDQEVLTRLLPQAKGHILEPWATYWELKNRLKDAGAAEVQAFLQRYIDTYQEDRLRNDWLLLLGERGEWNAFLHMLASFRMNDDPDVVCYTASAQGAPAKDVTLVLQSWQSLGRASDACSQAAQQLFIKKALHADELWRLARVGAERKRLQLMQQAVSIVAPGQAGALPGLVHNPARYLKRLGKVRLSEQKQQMAVLALTRLAARSWESAANAMQKRWSKRLPKAKRAWVWAEVGKSATRNLSPKADAFYALAPDKYLSDDLLQWKVRAALRAGHWKTVLGAIMAMKEGAQTEVTWQYWKARAFQALGKKSRAQALFVQIANQGASPDDFYEQLALEELGRKIVVPSLPESVSALEMQAMFANGGLSRALYAFDLGLRSIAVREWHYETSLHTPGGMNDRQRLAAAALACKHAVWDRCINTSARSKQVFHAQQRYPTPFQDDIKRHSLAADLDSAYVYGLIRQESRFIGSARSGAGASGLMQVILPTARAVAKKIALKGYRDAHITDLDVNLRIGTSYLRMVLADFEGSKPLALAAYNAGPSRSRRWRKGPTLEPAIWIETIPFTETRDYVKKVLANTVLYSALLNNSVASLQAYLGASIGPRDSDAPAPDAGLP